MSKTEGNSQFLISISNAYGACGTFLSNLGSNLGAYLGIRS